MFSSIICCFNLFVIVLAVASTVRSQDNETVTAISNLSDVLPVVPLSVIPLTDSTYWDCGLSTTPETIQLLKDRTSNHTSLLYLKLNFLHDDSNFTQVNFSDTIRALLKNKSSVDVVDPRTWIWAKEGRGTKLLTCSYDFKILSLTTLNLGVATVKPVDIILPSNDTNCFWNASDELKLNILAKSISQLIESTVLSGHDSAEPGDTVFKVCLERVNPNPNVFYKLLLDAHILRQLSTTYDCWKIVKDSREVGHVIYRDKITTAWLVVLYLIGVLIALFFPFLLVSCFTWKNPPKEIEGRSWISLNTSSLPVGTKYSIFLWQPKTNPGVITTGRALVTIMILFSIQYIPILCSLIQDPELFWTHKKALDRTGLLRPSRDYMYVLSDIVCCLIPSIIFTLLYNSDNDRGLFKKTLRNSISIEAYSCNIKEHGSPGDEYQSDLHILYKNMKTNFDSILDPTAWASAICSYWVILNIPGLIIRALPLAYCGLLIVKTAIWCLTNDILGAILLLFVLLTFYFFTIKIITIFIYMAQICAYTYTGIVTNADNLGLVFVIVLLCLFFILTALTLFYDKYYELFMNTVTVAEDIWKIQACNTQDSSSLLKTESNQMQSNQAQPRVPPTLEHNGNERISESKSKVIDDVKQHHSKTRNRIVAYTDRQVPMIEMELFTRVVENYMPYRKAIADVTLRQILPVIIVSICGYQVVNDIGANQNFFSIFNFLSTVALSGALPAISNIIGSSRSEVMCDLESRKRDIRQFIVNYVEEKHLEHLAEYVYEVDVAQSQPGDDKIIGKDYECQNSMTTGTYTKV